MRAGVHQPPAVQHGDAVGELEGGLPVRDQQRRAPGHDRAQRVVDLVLDAGVDGRGGVVQDQQSGVGEDGAGQRDALPLAAGEREALFADDRVVPLGERGDERVGLRGARGCPYLLLARLRVPVGEVGADGVGEEEAVLRHQADRGAQRGVREVPDVLAADPHGAAVGVVEPRQQQRHRRLAAAGGAHHGQRLARLDAQRQVVQHRRALAVAEADGVELDRGGRVGGQFVRAGGLADLRLGVDQFEHALHAGPRLLAHGEDDGEHPHRADELGQVGGERHERAERDPALGRHPAAQRQHGDLAERGNGLEDGRVPGREPDGPQPRREQLPTGGPQLPRLLLLLPEALDDAHARDGPVDDAGDRARLVLRDPGGGEEAGAAALRDPPQRGRDGQRDQGQGRREGQHDDQGDREQHQVPDGHGHHEQQALDQLEVTGGAADDLTGAQLVLPPAVQPGDAAEHLGAQIVLHVDAEPPAVVAADVRERVDDEGRGRQQADPQAETALLADHDVVDDDLDDQRHERHHAHADERGADREQEIAPVPPAVGGQPPYPSAVPCRHRSASRSLLTAVLNARGLRISSHCNNMKNFAAFR